MPTIDPIDLLLTLIYYATNKGKNQIGGRKRLQKIVCILQHDFNIPFDYTFVKHYYGPYSKDLQDDLEFLTFVGVVKEDVSSFGRDVEGYCYQLSEEGIELVESITELDIGIKNILSEEVPKLAKKGITTLINEAYTSYYKAYESIA